MTSEASTSLSVVMIEVPARLHPEMGGPGQDLSSVHSLPCFGVSGWGSCGHGRKRQSLTRVYGSFKPRGLFELLGPASGRQELKH